WNRHDSRADQRLLASSAATGPAGFPNERFANDVRPRTRSASRNTQICRTLAGGAEDTRHVERVVHVRHEVPESGRTAQPGRERLADHASVTETLKRVGVAGRRAELEVQARGR